ncbi:hypothetical protein CR51_22160 [Caballeronia megalochromosomata]|nr:hypothetical protein CR51_22160 [Caballeronia megalochromosomata]
MSQASFLALTTVGHDRTTSTMRITVHLDTFDRVSPCAYAILEIDKCSRHWICSGQHGLHIPREGTIEKADAGAELRRSQDNGLICILESFDAFPKGPFERETGPTLWYGEQGIQPAPGHWHVELVTDDSKDRTSDAV